MRIFNIDYTNSDNMLPDGDVLGYRGEHNATQLVITPPQEMSDNESIISYRIAFGLTNCRAVHSEPIEKTETVSMLLFSQITSSEIISVQLEGYSDDNSLIAKSETVKKLKFSESVCGVETSADGSAHGIVAEVNANSRARHTHPNSDVINNLGENESGALTYNGKSVQRPTATITTSDIYVTDMIGLSGHTAAIGSYDELLPEGTEIKTIRIKWEDEWVDIHDMYIIDGVPYILNFNKVWNNEDTALYVFAMVSFVTSGYNAITSMGINASLDEIEIEYYTDGGVSVE